MSKNNAEIVVVGADQTARHPEPKYENLLRHEFSLLLVAPPGQGKTNLICNFLLNHYKGYFHEIFVSSPSVETDDKWEYVKKQRKILVRNKHKDKIEEIEEEMKNEDSTNSKSKIKIKQRQETQRRGSVKKLQDEKLKTRRGLGFPKTKPKLNSPIVREPKVREPLLRERQRDPYTKHMANRLNSKKHPNIYRKYDPLSKYNKNNNDSDSSSDSEDSEDDDDDETFTGKIPESHFAKDFNKQLPQIQKKKKVIQKLSKIYGTKKAMEYSNRCFVIIDDQAGLFKDSTSQNPVINFFFNHRHHNCSIVLVTQAYKAIPRPMRTSMSGLVAFFVGNAVEKKTIWEEWSHGLNYKDWDTIYMYCISEDKSFMFINVRKPAGQRFHKRFIEVIPTEHLLLRE